MSHSDTVPMLTDWWKGPRGARSQRAVPALLQAPMNKGPGVARSGDAARKVRAPQYMHERHGRITALYFATCGCFADHVHAVLS